MRTAKLCDLLDGLNNVTNLVELHYGDCELLDVWHVESTARYDVYRAKLIDLDGEVKMPTIRCNDLHGAWFA